MSVPQLIFAVVTAALSVAENQQQIKAQDQQAKAEIDAANAAATNDYMAVQEQQRQLSEANNIDIQERQAQAMRERSRMMVAMGEANVIGASPLRDIAASYLLENKDTGIMATSYRNKLDQTRREMFGVFANAQGRNNAASSRLSTPWTRGLQIGGAAISGFASGYSGGAGFVGLGLSKVGSQQQQSGIYDYSQYRDPDYTGWIPPKEDPGKYPAPNPKNFYN